MTARAPTPPASPSGTFRTLLEVPEWVTPSAHLGSRRGLWWRRDREHLVWADLDTAAVETLCFRDLPAGGEVTLYADRRHLVRKEGGSFELWERDRGLIARRNVPPPPPSTEPILGGRPQRELHWFSGDNRHLWYMGYDERGAPVLYLFEGRSLRLMDTAGPPMSIGRVDSHVPEALDWCSSPECFSTYPGGEPVGLFSARCDELGYFLWLAVGPEGTLENRATRELQRAAAQTSDLAVSYLRSPQADRLLAINDLHEVLRIDVTTCAIDLSARFLAPFESALDPDYLEVAPYRGRARSDDFIVTTVVNTDTHIYLELGVADHLAQEEVEALDDFPWLFYLMLDAATLQPVGFVNPYSLGDEAEEVQDVRLLEGGTIAVQLAGAAGRRLTRFVAWTA